ncbi:MAG TPA: hypothetical protein VG028_13410 [Terriglobia bacterium]|nr:hypothetical protein [Terriglobia bacterium]
MSLHFEVSGPNSQPHVRAVDRRPPELVGGVRLYGKAPGPFTITWKQSARGPRCRTTRKSYKAARQFAGELSDMLASGEIIKRDLAAAECITYVSARRKAQSIGESVPGIIDKYTEYVQKLLALDPPATVDEAIRSYLSHRAPGLLSLNVPDIVKLLLEQKAKHQVGAKWLRTLKFQLERFAEAFPGPIRMIQPHEINAWLGKLDVGLVTRRHYHDAMRELIRFAQAENCLDKNWDGLKHIANPEPPPVEVKLYTPEQVAGLLACCTPGLLPFLAIQFFAGVRHEEMSAGEKALVDWSDVLWEKSLIRIRKITAKTKKLRLIKMQPNLVAWLQPYARKSGRICSIRCTGDALYRLGKRAGIPWIRNGARKAFISYRLAQTNDMGLVAREAGNSQKVIESNYLELVTEQASREYFAIFPPAQDRIIQMDFAFGR